MEHHAPHPGASFEGYYSKFYLPSGAHVALIICSVRNAKVRPHKVSFTYVPKGGPHRVFQKELWPANIEMTKLSDDHAFELRAPGIGCAKWDADSSTEYDISCEEFSFKARTTSPHTSWSPNETSSTPEDLLVNLPLPLHWHVQSLGTRCEFELHIPGFSDLAEQDKTGEAVVHQEKNWAQSFPSAHMWLQARSPSGDSTFCAAGGQILGMEAFLLGYRGKDIALDFRPPFATRVLGLSPSMSYATNWEDRSFELSVQSFRQKIVVRARAPKGTFFSLSAPFSDGHQKNMLAQSFEAVVEVMVYESGWISPWKLVAEDRFENASLEFGAGYYPPAGTAERFH